MEGDRDEVLERIDSLKEVIRKTPADLLQENLYAPLANGCILLMSYKRDNGEPGWSSKLHTELHEPMLSKEQQIQIESIFSENPWLLDFLNEGIVQKGQEHGQDHDKSKGQDKGQKGGNPTVRSAGSAFIKDINPPKSVNQNDISMDLIFEKFINKSNEMDEFWGKFAYDAPGVAKLINGKDFMVTTPYGIIPVPLKPIVQFLIVLLDSIRLSYALSGKKSNIMTLIVLLEEVVTGQWRQMILTAAGFISPSGVAVGILLKYIVNTLMLMSPDLRTQIAKDSFKGTKSIFIGFLLWAATTFPPKIILKPVETALDKARDLVTGFDTKIQDIAEKGSAGLREHGKAIDFPALKLDTIKKISLQDIQNIQSLSQSKLINCTQEFQDIIEPLKKNIFLRFILEILNVPTTDTDKFEMCGTDIKPMTEMVKDSVKPAIINAAEATSEASEAPKPEAEDKDKEPEAEDKDKEPEAEAKDKEPEAEDTPKPEAEDKAKEPEASKPEASKPEAEDKDKDKPSKPEDKAKAKTPASKSPSKGLKGGALQLKKTTRFRKQTPKRQTRQLPRQQGGVRKSRTL